MTTPRWRVGDVYSESQVSYELMCVIEDCGSQKAAAARLGFSSAFINDVLRRRRGITHALAAALGFRVETVYIYSPIPEDPEVNPSSPKEVKS